MSNGKPKPSFGRLELRAKLIHVETTFGERLKLAMDAKHLNARQLHVATSLSESAISRHLERKKHPRLESVEAYVAALDVSLDWLAYGKGGMYPEKPGVSASPIPVGVVALEQVLESYEWPPGLEIETIDAIIETARFAASRSPGSTRPASAWRALLASSIRKHFESNTGVRHTSR